MAKKASVPVFVFLDENIAHVDEKIAEYFTENLPEEVDRFDLIFFPFPTKRKGGSKNRGKGKTDFEVACFVKKLIFSDSRIGNCLHHKPKPQFIFLTRDLNFIEDVFKEMQRDGKHVGSIIMPAENTILFFDKETTVPLSIVNVRHKPNIRKKAMVAAISESLRNFLNKNFY